MNGGQHQIIWYFSACKVTKHRKSTCTKWSSPWLRGAGALHWCSTAGCHTIPISFLPASRNNLRKKTQPVRSSQSCSTKENQRICFRPTPVSISGSITDALKVLILIPPLCQRPVCSCTTAQVEYTEGSPSSLAPFKKLLPKALSCLSCSSSLPQSAKIATGNLTYGTSAP